MWWTLEMDEKLVADFVRIGTLSGVAREWGFTRNQVIGRAQRIGLTAFDKRKADLARYKETYVPKPRKATTGRSVRRAKVSRPRVKPAVVEAPIVPAEAPTCEPMDFIAEDNVKGRCRYGVGERASIMCGAPVHAVGSAWCGYHRSLVYVPDSKRKTAEREIHNAGYLAVNSKSFQSKIVPKGW